ncbi:MAG: methionine synthase [Clostridium sp.]|uniref:methionine synthase n=1 Tax=Clostridium sp. TaxID=1506 RepID=UPI003F3E7F23
MDNLNIPLEEVLRYLGYKGQALEEDFLEKVKEIREKSKAFFRPKFVYESYGIKKINGEILIEGTTLKLKSDDINNLLKDSEKMYLMAVTLGNDIEKLIRRYERISMTDALILDACATTAIEEYIDNLEADIKLRELKEEENFTFRYSPGYGDLSLDVQKEIINVLNCQRRIGLTASENKILFPRKSVTAILGVIKGEKKKKSCANCKNYKTCMFRKEGDVCGCS